MTRNSKRLRVLVSAYACSPVHGSEPGMGWGWVEALSRYHDLWVITEKEKFEPEIEAELEKRPELREAIRFYYIPKTRHKTLRKIWPPSYYWFYKAWQKKAHRLALRLHKEVDFDLFHQLNMIGYREPGYLWKFDKPFVWGPVGGTGGVPVRFYTMLGIHGFLFHSCRNLINVYKVRFDKRVRYACERADIFVAATSDVRDVFHKAQGKNGVVIHETGKVCALALNKKGRPNLFNDRPIKFSWSGLHISLKALPIALKALARVPKKNSWHFDIIGSGPMTKKWQRLAEKLGIAAHCTWYGWLSQAEATRIVSDSDVLLFTSLKEGTPHAVMEALTIGVPIICFDHCGQKDIVTKECGVKIPVISPKHAVLSFASAIQELVENQEILSKLSEGVAKFSESERHTYETKAKLMSELYRKAIDNFLLKKACSK